MKLFTARLQYPVNSKQFVYRDSKMSEYSYDKEITSHPSYSYERKNYSMQAIQGGETDTYVVRNKDSTIMGQFKISKHSIEVEFDQDSDESKEVMLSMLGFHANKYNYSDMPKPTLHIKACKPENNIADFLQPIEAEVQNALSKKADYVMANNHSLTSAEVSISLQSQKIYADQLKPIEDAFKNKYDEDSFKAKWDKAGATYTFNNHQGTMKFDGKTGGLSISDGNNEALQEKLIEAAKVLYEKNPHAQIKVTSANKDIENKIAEALQEALPDAKIVRSQDLNQKVGINNRNESTPQHTPPGASSS